MHQIRHLLLHKLPLATRAQDEDLRRRKPVLYVLFIATFVVLALTTLTLVLEYTSGFNRLVLHRLLAVTAALLIVLALQILLKFRHYFIAAFGILGIYWLLATIMVLHWGVNLPIALLLYGIVIMLSGIVLGARCALYALVGSAVILFAIQHATLTGHLHPDTSWRREPTQMGDLIGYFFAFIILGISSWLYNRHTDMALHQALRAEVALQREKAMLETKIERRTRELQAAQIDKMQQLYRFTQLGQFSTSLMHDLANHIATLSVDIEGMSEKQHYQSQLQLRVKRRIAYIDNTVQWAYDHIHGTVRAENFNVRNEVAEVIKILQYNARQAGVRLQGIAKSDSPLMLHGDINRFRQLVLNLVSNAIEAYRDSTNKSATREVRITGEQLADNGIRITVQDWGGGIPASAQDKIFDPFYSTKYDGMGIGLFIVKQVAEEYFGGSIQLTSRDGTTIFDITLHGSKHD